MTFHFTRFRSGTGRGSNNPPDKEFIMAEKRRKSHKKKRGMSASRIRCAWKNAKRRGKKKLDKKAFKRC